MEVVGHHAVGKHPHRVASLSLDERLDERLIVGVAFEERRATHRPVQDVEHEARGSCSSSGRHVVLLSNWLPSRQSRH